MKRSPRSVVTLNADVLRPLGLGLLVLVLAVLTAAQPARAAFGFQSFTNDSRQSDGSEETQAGRHPYSTTVTFALNTATHPISGEAVPDEHPKELTVDLPAGFVGDPTAAAACSTIQVSFGIPTCPVDSQVGVVVVDFAFGSVPPSTAAYPVFNMIPGKGQLARFAFNPGVGTPVNIVASVRSDSDYGVRAKIIRVPEAAPFIGTRLTLWGNPADPSHDFQRGGDWNCTADPELDPGSCVGGGKSVSGAAKAFLTNPTYCGDPLTSSISSNSWENPDVFSSLDYTSASGMTGCDALTFEPSIDVDPDLLKADAPTGLTVDLSIPQNTNPAGLATATLRDAVVTLPVGTSLNAPQADKLEGCTDAQIGLHSTAPVACPPASKVGDITIDTPLLAEQLTGAIYVGEPVPGKTFRIFLSAGSEERGVSIRLEGVLDLHPVTGQVTATFEDNPQLPFNHMRLHFKGGPRAPLATPQTCGTHTATASLTPWADPRADPVVVTSSFTISYDGNGAPCPARGFAPGFSAGLTNPVGGADSAFTMTLTRADYEQELKSIAMKMPKGLLARIADVPVLCEAPQAAAGTCDEGSRIGSVTTGVGAGTSPFFLPGRVYVTKAYNGGPFGLSIVVPAIAGPFDLGTVVVRASIRIDRKTAELSVVSDPLPTIVEGVPLRLRVVNVHIDREHFMFAPTNCTPSSVDGTIGSTTGATAAVSTRFQVANCAGLSFKPRMIIRVGGKGHNRVGNSTPLEAIVRMTPGQANLKGVKVSLPKTLNALLTVINEACTVAEFDAGTCEEARAGTAVAVTPLLRDPLVGGVYFVENGRALPDLMVALKGQVDFDLVGKVTIPSSNRLETHFDTVPDVPITKFALRLVGDENGPIGVARNLCAKSSRRQKVNMTFRAQNGKVVRVAKRLRVRGCATGRAAGGT